MTTSGKMSTNEKKATTKGLGARKQWKMLCEYATQKNGDVSQMCLDDHLYPEGPTIGKFLLDHYVTKCVTPSLSARARIAAAAAPVATEGDAVDASEAVTVPMADETEPGSVAEEKEKEKPATAPESKAKAPPVPPRPEKRALDKSEKGEEKEKGAPTSPKKKRVALKTVLKL